MQTLKIIGGIALYLIFGYEYGGGLAREYVDDRKPSKHVLYAKLILAVIWPYFVFVKTARRLAKW